MHDLRVRSTAEVFQAHLRLAGEHRFEEDIERNVSPDIVVLERQGINGVGTGAEVARDSKIEESIISRAVRYYSLEVDSALSDPCLDGSAPGFFAQDRRTGNPSTRQTV